MKLIKTRSGFIAYKAVSNEAQKAGIMPVCGHCSLPIMEDGVLVPVLDRILCPSCFKKWDEHCRYMPAYEPREDETARRYESLIRLEDIGA